MQHFRNKARASRRPDKKVMCRAIKIFVVLAAMTAMVSAQDERSASDFLKRALHLADLYNWADAAQDFAAAERMFRASGDERNALYAHLGAIRSNIERDRRTLLQTSSDLASQLETNPLLQSDKELRMFCLVVKGDLDTETDPRAMRDDWEQVQALARELDDVKWQNRALGQLGMAAFYNGDVATARKDIATVLLNVTKTGDKGAQIRYFSVAGLGLVMVRMYEQSLPYLDNALRIAATVPDAGYPFATQLARLNALVGLKRIEAAQNLAQEIITHAKQTGRRSLEAAALGLLGQVDRIKNDRSAAIKRLAGAASLANSIGAVREVAGAQNAMAEIYRESGDMPSAERFAALAAESTQASGDLWAVPQRLQTLARIEVDRGEFQKADRVYDRADAFVDSMLGNVSAILDKTALITASSAIYADHFSLVVDRLHNSRKAYSILEQVRGRVAADLLRAGSIATADAKKEEHSLSQLRLRLMSARSNDEVRRIRDQVFLLEQARWVTPDVNILKARVEKPISLEQVQQSLPQGSAILEFVVADHRSYCLSIKRDSIRVVPLRSGKEIRQLAAAFLKSVKAKSSADDQARELYEILLAPIGEALKSETIVVVPDGPLHLIPFEALIDEGGQYLAQSHRVIYAPSATSFYLLSNQQESADATRALLGVGGIPYNTGELEKVSVTRGYDVHGLADLPASKDEVLAADAEMHNPKNTLLLGPEATESAFKKLALSRYGIIHLAVHGLANTSDADHSALVLLSDPRAGEDGYLQASEVVQLKLNADLVVLSACDTAVGPVEGEEGIATLARSFLLAGGRAVVSTLWAVDDTFSLFLMKQFYKHLGEGEAPAFALSVAKRDMLKRFGREALPYYWASFKFEGALSQSNSRRTNSR